MTYLVNHEISHPTYVNEFLRYKLSINIEAGKLDADILYDSKRFFGDFWSYNGLAELKKNQKYG